jgi:hypothetical protein
MKNVFIVCEKIDLGVHPVVGFTSEEKANERERLLTEKEKSRVKTSLINSCNYSDSQAEDFVKNIFPYEVWEVEIKE